MREAAVVIGEDGQPCFWHLPGDRTQVSIPDTRTLFDVLWENRKTVQGVAHSHPGSGVPGPSYEDVTTFTALESCLGVRLRWWITSETHLVVAQWVGPDKLHYPAEVVISEPAWADELRANSGQKRKRDES